MLGEDEAKALFAAFLLGAIASAVVTWKLTKEHWQLEAIQSGSAHWATTESGSAEFAWGPPHPEPGGEE